MRKAIYFPPYTEAEVKAINEDGSVLCDLYGGQRAPGESGAQGSEDPPAQAADRWEYTDTDICFPADSEILSLTRKEKAAFMAEQQKAMNYEEAV